MALEKVGLFEKGKNSMKIMTNLWIDCLKNTDTSDCIESNLGLTQGSFKKEGKEKEEKTLN